VNDWFLLRQTLSIYMNVCVCEHMLKQRRRKRQLITHSLTLWRVTKNHMILIKGPAQLSPQAANKK